MIKAFGRDGQGGPMLLMGLSKVNVTRLMAGQPIRFDLAELGLPPMTVLIVGGVTEEAIETELRVAGLLGPDATFLGGGS